MDTPINPTDSPIDPRQPRSRRTRRNAAIGATTGLIGGGLVGLMLTVPSLTSAARPSADVQAEPGTRLREVLQPLVDDGTISAEQADAVTEHIVANRPERGDRGHGGRGGFGRRGMHSEVLTEVLGIDKGWPVSSPSFLRNAVVECRPIGACRYGLSSASQRRRPYSR